MLKVGPIRSRIHSTTSNHKSKRGTVEWSNKHRSTPSTNCLRIEIVFRIRWTERWTTWWRIQYKPSLYRKLWSLIWFKWTYKLIIQVPVFNRLLHNNIKGKSNQLSTKLLNRSIRVLMESIDRTQTRWGQVWTRLVLKRTKMSTTNTQRPQSTRDHHQTLKDPPVKDITLRIKPIKTIEKHRRTKTISMPRSNIWKT